MMNIVDSSMPRIGVVSVRALLFPGSSLSREAALVGALSRGHRLGEVCIQCGADFFEPNLVCFHLLLWPDREGLHALQNANQPVYIPVPQIEFSEDVHSHVWRCLSPTLRSGLRPTSSSRAASGRWIDLTICRLLVRSRKSSIHIISKVVGRATTWSQLRP